jgi:hypothetical protein
MVSLWLNKKGDEMKTLATEQQQNLVVIINDEFGVEMNLTEFTEALLGLLEDIAGFETAPQNTINKLTQQIWSQYHE